METRSTADATDMVALLQARALEWPARLALAWLDDGEAVGAAFTYGELDRDVRRLAGWLQARTAPGDRVLLLYPQGLAFVTAFFACLYAGVVAVPAYPPRQARNVERLAAIAADCGASLVLGTSALIAQLGDQADWQGAQLAACEDLSAEGEDAWRRPAIAPADLAFLQYTSGSTGSPKGVMVTHANLMANERMIQAAVDTTEDAVVLTWTPLFHDLGLIFIMLQAVYAGAPCYLMDPGDFIRRPRRWLEAISTLGVTHTGGPNFGYEHCLRRIPPGERHGLDLSRWTHAYNCAEPVREDTIARFTDAFSAGGFRRETFFPCYGLAEATVYVSGRRLSAAPATLALDEQALALGRVQAAGDAPGKTLVGCGQVGLEAVQQVVIVDPDTHLPCPPDRLGEVWVAGPHVAAGYWRQEAASREAFGACLRDTGDGPFLRTGDLGFLHAGELYLAGRRKDVMIIRGANHYPQDVERTAEASHPAVRPGCAIAFSVEVDGEERPVLVAEVAGDADLPAVGRAIRQAVQTAHELQLHAVRLVQAGTVPKTSSGKVQRRACREAFLADGLVSA